VWIYTTRPGFEADLVEELGKGAVKIAPALVSIPAAPKTWPVFARAGFLQDAELALATPEAVSVAVAASLQRAFAGKPKSWLLQSWVPDADESNVHAALATSLGARVENTLAAGRPDLELRRVQRADEALRYEGVLVQMCLVSPNRVLVGALPAQDSPTLAPGGRARSYAPKDAPSRAARKLTEALEWIRRGPEPGEVCVDLGAAPGGWTVVALERRARVIAVDPANLAPELARRKGVAHVKLSAFDFAPEEPVDWLLCDMAWRPLEVAALLAKWGRRRLASALVANIKLPMKQRVSFVRQVLKIVADGGWQDVKGRQLYHDREEITLSAWRT
jgi:23S rRNA (cytidine2498-2'-O)-methyltransferase